MIAIGITGRARSGKGTISTAIQEACEDRYDCKIYEISNFVLNDLNRLGKLPGKTRAMLDPEDLDLMVEHGSEKRKVNPRYWLDCVVDAICKDRPEIAVLPNIRFLNEAELVRKLGNPGRIIRVKTFVFDGVEYISRDRDPNSIMEIEQEKIEADYFVTVKRGDPQLTKDLSKVIFEKIINEKN